MTKPTQSKAYWIETMARLNFRLVPLKGKIPPAAWQKVSFNMNPDPKKFPQNYGVVLDADHLVVDVDPRNFVDGRDSLRDLSATLCVNLLKVCNFKVRTGGGGYHLYFKRPRSSKKVVNGLAEFPGIEFKSVGRQVVGPGSIHPDTKKIYEALDSAPTMLKPVPYELLDMILREETHALEKGLKDYDDSSGNVQWVREALRKHPPAVEGQEGDMTTLKAVYLCRDSGLSPAAAYDLLLEYNERCIPQWTPSDLRIKVKNGYKYAQNAVGATNPAVDFDDVATVVAEEKKPEERPAAPQFLDDIRENWCYSIGSKEFYDLRKMRSYDKEQFDDIHSGKTDKKKPSAFAIGCPMMRKVELPTYAPGQDQFIDEGGEEKLNLYRPPSVKAEQGDVSFFLEFVDFLLGPDKAWIFHDFITYILRNPGEKVLWAVLLQGDPGVGKSLLARTAIRLLGASNVSQPTNQIVHEKYTGWLKSCQLVIVHELMAMGRLEMLNKLKDPITEPTIVIREMFRPAYEIPNRANFLFLTNHEDSIVIPDKDRRFAVIFSPAKKREKSYYKKLVEWIDSNSGILYDYYLHRHQFDEKFDAKAEAPMTREKQTMIASTRHPVEASVMDMFEDQADPFHGDLADITSILDRLKNSHRGLNYLSLAMHLKNCGFRPLGDRIRLTDGRRVRLWAIRRIPMLENLEIDKLRAIFEDQERKALEKADADVLRDFK